MLIFLFMAALMVLVTLLVLLRPWQRQHDAATTSARDINTRVRQHQLQELERDLASGTLSPADHAQARTDLQRQLLEDASATAPRAGAASALTRSWHGLDRSRVILALAIPVLAASLYAHLGSPQALSPAAANPTTPLTQANVEAMVAGLAERLKQKPNDPAGWAVLARSYRLMGRLPEAQNAFERIGAPLQLNPTLLTEYADVLAATAQGNLEGEPLALIQRALQIAPDHPMALALAATAAFNRRDLPQALSHWERLLKQLPPDSEDARWITQQLQEAQSGIAPSPSGVASSAHTVPPEAIRGRVSLAPEFLAQTSPNDTVFVFARAAQGPRMPLAVQRARVADLPLDFQLDDATAMNPGAKLSSATEVRIEARISKTGNATPSPGDLIGTGPTVKPGTHNLAFQINQVRGAEN